MSRLTRRITTARRCTTPTPSSWWSSTSRRSCCHTRCAELWSDTSGRSLDKLFSTSTSSSTASLWEWSLSSWCQTSDPTTLSSWQVKQNCRTIIPSMKCPSCHILRPHQILCSATVVKMLKNVSYNFSVYTDCNFVQDNLHLKKESPIHYQKA